jgi:hypothetical protein
MKKIVGVVDNFLGVQFEDYTTYDSALKICGVDITDVLNQ